METVPGLQRLGLRPDVGNAVMRYEIIEVHRDGDGVGYCMVRVWGEEMMVGLGGFTTEEINQAIASGAKVSGSYPTSGTP